MKGLVKTITKSKGTHALTWKQRGRPDNYQWSGHLGHSSTKSKPKDWTGYACIEMLLGGIELSRKDEEIEFRRNFHSFCEIIKDAIGLEDVCVDVELNREYSTYAGYYGLTRGSICFANITMKKYRELCNKFDYDYETQVCSEKGDWW